MLITFPNKKGLGVQFSKDLEDWYVVQNLSKHPVYIFVKGAANQFELEPG